MVTFLLSGGSRCSPVATCLFFVWLGHDSFMRHDLSVCLRVAHVIAHAPLFSRFTVPLLGFRSFLKSMCRLYMLVIHFPFPSYFFSAIFVFLRKKSVHVSLAFLGILFSPPTCFLNPALPRSSVSTPRPVLEGFSSVVCIYLPFPNQG